VIIKTAEGFEALGCSGLPEAMRYDGVPPSLVAKPTLSVDTRSDGIVSAVVQLSYLANEFDWNADYVVRLSRDKSTLDLFAWLTIANGNGESFVNAQTQAIAGKVNRDEDSDGYDDDAAATDPAAALSLQCWPQDITSTHPAWDNNAERSYGMQGDGYLGRPEDILVTARRSEEMLQSSPVAVTAFSAEMLARQEALGDLKLYRIPEPVTVAANAQKQVAFLQKNNVPFELVYRVGQYLDTSGFESQSAQRILQMHNKKGDGLGVPLPQGSVAVFEPNAGQWLLVSENGEMNDTPVGEKVEFEMGWSDQVKFELQRLGKPGKPLGSGDKPDTYVLSASNANPFPIKVDFPLRYSGGKLKITKGKVVTEFWPMWKATVPANGKAELRFSFKDD
jgi:hypothetical protein